jgi:hypothetical protein
MRSQNTIGGATMSLKPTAIEPVPATTAPVARAAFPRGNVYLILRDALGTIFHDADFVGFCRKFQFSGQNPKIRYQKFNNL